jgi:hypothetical protein
MVHQDAVHLGSEGAQVLKVLHADGASADLVLVGRADAAPGGADLALAGSGLAQHVKFAVQRQDQRGVLGDPQALRRHGQAPACQPLDLLGQRPRVDDDAVAENRELALAYHARGKEGELVDLVADHQGMPGVVAALEADDNVSPLREPVDNLALAFVAPLGAYHNHICHVSSRIQRAPPMNAAATIPAQAGTTHRPVRCAMLLSRS